MNILRRVVGRWRSRRPRHALALAGGGVIGGMYEVGVIAAFEEQLSGAGDFDIYVVRSDGSRVRRLTRTTTSEDDPAWSRDGASIVYARGTLGSRRLMIMNSDGSGARRLTGGPWDDGGADWAPLSVMAFAR